MVNTLLAFLFLVIGGVIGKVGLNQTWHNLFFGIPITLKLNKGKILKPRNPILRNYIRSIIVWGAMSIIVTVLVFMFAGTSQIIGYCVGTVLSFIFSFGRVSYQDKLYSYNIIYGEYFNEDFMKNQGDINVKRTENVKKN